MIKNEKTKKEKTKKNTKSASDNLLYKQLPYLANVIMILSLCQIVVCMISRKEFYDAFVCGIAINLLCATSLSFCIHIIKGIQTKRNTKDKCIASLIELSKKVIFVLAIVTTVSTTSTFLNQLEYSKYKSVEEYKGLKVSGNPCINEDVPTAPEIHTIKVTHTTLNIYHFKVTYKSSSGYIVIFNTRGHYPKEITYVDLQTDIAHKYNYFSHFKLYTTVDVIGFGSIEIKLNESIFNSLKEQESIRIIIKANGTKEINLNL